LLLLLLSLCQPLLMLLQLLGLHSLKGDAGIGSNNLLLLLLLQRLLLLLLLQLLWQLLPLLLRGLPGWGCFLPAQGPALQRVKDLLKAGPAGAAKDSQRAAHCTIWQEVLHDVLCRQQGSNDLGEHKLVRSTNTQQNNTQQPWQQQRPVQRSHLSRASAAQHASAMACSLP
jgi:hypothetical protein